MTCRTIALIAGELVRRLFGLPYVRAVYDGR